MMIAQYWASLGFRVDKKELRKVDTALKQFEKKLKVLSKKFDKALKLQINVGNFTVDEKKLKAAVGNALDRASNTTVFQISRFSVNERALKAALLRAGRRSGLSAGIGGGIMPRPLSAAEWNRREGVKNEEWDRRRREIRADQEARLAARQRLGTRAAMGAGAGGAVGGLMSRAFAPALIAGAGYYGMGQLNRKNQEIVSAQLMTQAIVQQAGGTAYQGQESFEWLKGQANRIGFNFLEAAPDFNKLLSGLTGAGMTVGQGQDVFKGFAELARVNKLDKTSQNRLFRALSQVAGKNQLMSEELTGQIAEALPGGVAIFAEAYQRQIGGNLQGSEAIQALRAAMEKRQVKGDILTFAADVAASKAAPGLEAAQKASQAEQQRFQNAYNIQAGFASEMGVESGFARLFRSMTAAMEEATPMVMALAKGFDELSKYVSFAMLIPQSFKRAFEGRDSYVADLLGEANVQLIKEFTEGLSEIGSEIKKTLGTALDGWGIIFTEFGPELLKVLNKIKDVFLYTFTMLNALVSGDLNKASNAGLAMTASLNGATPEEVKAIAAGESVRTDQGSTGIELLKRTPPALMFDVVTGVYKRIGEETGITNVGEGFAETFRGSAQRYKDNKEQMRTPPPYLMQQGGGTNNINISEGAFVINTQASDGESLARELEPHIKSLFRTEQNRVIGEALLMNPNKE